MYARQASAPSSLVVRRAVFACLLIIGAAQGRTLSAAAADSPREPDTAELTNAINSQQLGPSSVLLKAAMVTSDAAQVTSASVDAQDRKDYAATLSTSQSREARRLLATMSLQDQSDASESTDKSTADDTYTVPDDESLPATNTPLSNCNPEEYIAVLPASFNGTTGAVVALPRANGYSRKVPDPAVMQVTWELLQDGVVVSMGTGTVIPLFGVMAGDYVLQVTAEKAGESALGMRSLTVMSSAP